MYLSQNPTYRVALDGVNSDNVGKVRSAMIDQGVAPSRIETGAYGDPALRGDRNVAVLMSN